MARKAKASPDEQPAQAAASVTPEGKGSEPQGAGPFASTETAPKKQRISLGITEEGGFDWGSMRAETQERFKGALRSDLEVTRLMRPEVVGAGIIPGLVQPSHVGELLDLFAFGQRFFLPTIIAKQSEGKVRIEPDIAEKVFSFTEQQKQELGQPGANTLNELLPEVAQRWIVKGSDIGLFLGGLFITVKAQMEQAVLLQVQRDAARPKVSKPNGESKPFDVFAQPVTTEAAGVQG